MQSQSQIQTGSQVELATLDHVQRESEINQIAESVQDINAIFHDLDTLVQSQGEHVDRIEANVWSVSDNLERGTTQLAKAERWQRRKGWCGRLLMGIVAVIVLIFVLVIVA